MATTKRTGGPRSPVFLAAIAIVVLHAVAAAAIFVMTRPLAPEGSTRGRSGLGETAGRAWSWPGSLPPAQPAPAERGVANVTPPEVLSAPAVVHAEPVVPLPSDAEDRADVLAAVRQRRVAEMLERRMTRGAGAPVRPANRTRPEGEDGR